MDNVYLYADNDRVTDIFTTYRVSFQEAIEHEKTQHISRVIGSEILKASRYGVRVIFIWTGNILND
jgi:hypothetical protein